MTIKTKTRNVSRNKTKNVSKSKTFLNGGSNGSSGITTSGSSGITTSGNKNGSGSKNGSSSNKNGSSSSSKNGSSSNKNGSSNSNKKENLLVFYEDKININNKDLTGKYKLYSNEPTIVINNAKPNKIYMITMTDPDAPDGIEKQKNKTNKVFVHWVYIQMKLNTADEKRIIFIPYTAPSPPKGIHRYQFRLYDITNKIVSTESAPVKISGNDVLLLRLSKEELNKTDFRFNYVKNLYNFFQILNPNTVNEFKTLDSIQYKVSSKVSSNSRLQNIHSKIISQKKDQKLKALKETRFSDSSESHHLTSNSEQTPSEQQLQLKIQEQQKQIDQLQKQEGKRWGFGKTVVAITAADVGLNAMFNLF
jgi:phosphatidylethanolamine-binding protein (PEBP) family uncharacterized protein